MTTVKTAELLSALKAVARAAPRRTTLPVLSCVEIRQAAGESVLQLTCTDLDVRVTARIPATMSLKSWNLSVPVRKLRDFVKRAEGPELKLEPAGDRLALSSSTCRVRVIGFGADEFPVGPPLPAAVAAILRPGVLHRLVDTVAFAASTEESRPILNGCLLELRPGRIRLVATNGHRLVDREEGTAQDLPQLDAILPPGMLKAAAASFSKDNGVGLRLQLPSTPEELPALPEGATPQQKAARSDELRRRFHEAAGYAALSQGKVTIVGRLIEGPYPNYRQVYPNPEDVKTTVLVDRRRFAAAVERALVLASDQTHRMRCSFNGALQVGVETPDLGTLDEDLPIEKEGEPITIGFNGTYLKEILARIKTDRVSVSMVAPERSAIIRPELDDSMLALLMPLRLLD